MAEQVGQLSGDGQYFWDGATWQPAASPDGAWRWNGMAWAAVTRDVGFYRSAALLALFGVVGSPGVILWWSFQLLSFARREGLRDARSPWFILVPFFNLVQISRAFRGIHDSEASAGRSPLPLAAANVLYLASILASNVAGRVGAEVPALVGDVASVVLAGAVIWLVQDHANKLQAARHPEMEGRLGLHVTWGLVVAIVVGVLIEALVLVAILLPS